MIDEEREMVVRPDAVFESVVPRADQVRDTKRHARIPSAFPNVGLGPTRMAWPSHWAMFLSPQLDANNNQCSDPHSVPSQLLAGKDSMTPPDHTVQHICLFRSSLVADGFYPVFLAVHSDTLLRCRPR